MSELLTNLAPWIASSVFDTITFDNPQLRPPSNDTDIDDTDGANGNDSSRRNGTNDTRKNGNNYNDDDDAVSNSKNKSRSRSRSSVKKFDRRTHIAQVIEIGQRRKRKRNAAGSVPSAISSASTSTSTSTSASDAPGGTNKKVLNPYHVHAKRLSDNATIARNSAITNAAVAASNTHNSNPFSEASTSALASTSTSTSVTMKNILNYMVISDGVNYITLYLPTKEMNDTTITNNYKSKSSNRHHSENGNVNRNVNRNGNRNRNSHDCNENQNQNEEEYSDLHDLDKLEQIGSTNKLTSHHQREMHLSYTYSKLEKGSLIKIRNWQVSHERLLCNNHHDVNEYEYEYEYEKEDADADADADIDADVEEDVGVHHNPCLSGKNGSDSGRGSGRRRRIVTDQRRSTYRSGPLCLVLDATCPQMLMKDCIQSQDDDDEEYEIIQRRARDHDHQHNGGDDHDHDHRPSCMLKPWIEILGCEGMGPVGAPEDIYHDLNVFRACRLLNEGRQVGQVLDCYNYIRRGWKQPKSNSSKSKSKSKYIGGISSSSNVNECKNDDDDSQATDSDDNVVPNHATFLMGWRSIKLGNLEGFPQQEDIRRKLVKIANVVEQMNVSIHMNANANADIDEGKHSVDADASIDISEDSQDECEQDQEQERLQRDADMALQRQEEHILNKEYKDQGICEYDDADVDLDVDVDTPLSNDDDNGGNHQATTIYQLTPQSGMIMTQTSALTPTPQPPRDKSALGISAMLDTQESFESECDSRGEDKEGDGGGNASNGRDDRKRTEDNDKAKRDDFFRGVTVADDDSEVNDGIESQAARSLHEQDACVDTNTNPMSNKEAGSIAAAEVKSTRPIHMGLRKRPTTLTHVQKGHIGRNEGMIVELSEKTGSEGGGSQHQSNDMVFDKLAQSSNDTDIDHYLGESALDALETQPMNSPTDIDNSFIGSDKRSSKCSIKSSLSQNDDINEDVIKSSVEKYVEKRQVNFDQDIEQTSVEFEKSRIDNTIKFSSPSLEERDEESGPQTQPSIQSQQIEESNSKGGTESLSAPEIQTIEGHPSSPSKGCLKETISTQSGANDFPHDLMSQLQERNDNGSLSIAIDQEVQSRPAVSSREGVESELRAQDDTNHIDKFLNLIKARVKKSAPVQGSTKMVELNLAAHVQVNNTSSYFSQDGGNMDQSGSKLDGDEGREFEVTSKAPVDNNDKLSKTAEFQEKVRNSSPDDEERMNRQIPLRIEDNRNVDPSSLAGGGMESIVSSLGNVEEVELTLYDNVNKNGKISSRAKGDMEQSESTPDSEDIVESKSTSPVHIKNNDKCSNVAEGQEEEAKSSDPSCSTVGQMHQNKPIENSGGKLVYDLTSQTKKNNNGETSSLDAEGMKRSKSTVESDEGGRCYLTCHVEISNNGIPDDNVGEESLSSPEGKDMEANLQTQPSERIESSKGSVGSELFNKGESSEVHKSLSSTSTSTLAQIRRKTACNIAKDIELALVEVNKGEPSEVHKSSSSTTTTSPQFRRKTACGIAKGIEQGATAMGEEPIQGSSEKEEEEDSITASVASDVWTNVSKLSPGEKENIGTEIDGCGDLILRKRPSLPPVEGLKKSKKDSTNNSLSLSQYENKKIHSRKNLALSASPKSKDNEENESWYSSHRGGGGNDLKDNSDLNSLPDLFKSKENSTTLEPQDNKAFKNHGKSTEQQQKDTTHMSTDVEKRHIAEENLETAEKLVGAASKLRTDETVLVGKETLSEEEARSDHVSYQGYDDDHQDDMILETQPLFPANEEESPRSGSAPYIVDKSKKVDTSQFPHSKEKLIQLASISKAQPTLPSQESSYLSGSIDESSPELSSQPLLPPPSSNVILSTAKVPHSAALFKKRISSEVAQTSEKTQVPSKKSAEIHKRHREVIVLTDSSEESCSEDSPLPFSTPSRKKLSLNRQSSPSNSSIMSRRKTEMKNAQKAATKSIIGRKSTTYKHGSMSNTANNRKIESRLYDINDNHARAFDKSIGKRGKEGDRRQRVARKTIADSNDEKDLEKGVEERKTNCSDVSYKSTAKMESKTYMKKKRKSRLHDDTLAKSNKSNDGEVMRKKTNKKEKEIVAHDQLYKLDRTKQGKKISKSQSSRQKVKGPLTLSSIFGKKKKKRKPKGSSSQFMASKKRAKMNKEPVDIFAYLEG